MPRGYSSDSADTKEDYEKKDKAKVADPPPRGLFFSQKSSYF